MRRTDLFINGKKRTKAEALAPIFDERHRAAFETIRTYRGALFFLEAHLDRLFESAKTIGLKVSKTRAQLAQELKQCIGRDRRKEKFVRLMVDARNSYIFVRDLFPLLQKYRHGVDLKTSVIRRNAVHSLPPQAKSNAFANNVLAMLDQVACDRHDDKGLGMTKGKAFDIVFLDSDGYVVEASVWNIFAVKDRKLLTPQAGFLNGVTRQFVITCARLEHLPVVELNLTRHDVWNADEAFLTNAPNGIVPIRSLDGRRIGRTIPGRLTKRLERRFQKELCSQ